ncbi:MAG: DUF6629 family protein [Bacteroidota bacterium]
MQLLNLTGMCFSASASFIAGAALTVVGAASMSQVRKPAHYVFASIPLIFGIQQVCEGFVWLSLSGTDFLGWHAFFKYAFLFFAQIIWPFWIPLAFLCIEPSPKRRKIMRYFLFAGIAVTLLLTVRLIFSPAVAEIDGCHIAYKVGTTQAMQIATGILYICSIVVAPFFSSWKMAIILATVNLVSLIITNIFFEVYLVSVWCFFAAVQSVLIFFVMREMKRKPQENHSGR